MHALRGSDRPVGTMTYPGSHSKSNACPQLHLHILLGGLGGRGGRLLHALHHTPCAGLLHMGRSIPEQGLLLQESMMCGDRLSDLFTEQKIQPNAAHP